jgi:hypothetical protein
MFHSYRDPACTGNARIDRREDIVTRPVAGLSPGRLAVIWRTDDHREAVRVFTDSCTRCLCVDPKPWAA